MHVLSTLVCAQSTLSAFALPTVYSNRGLSTSLANVLLLDAPAFSHQTNPGNSIATFESFVYALPLGTTPIVSAFSFQLSKLGINVGNRVSTLADRAKLFAAVGLPQVTLQVNVRGCNGRPTLGKTAGLPDPGLLYRSVSIGHCANSNTDASTGATAALSTHGGSSATANVFFSPDSGFGVISDIDDTIKVTDVLDTVSTLKATFLDNPVPVAGMPELYASLSKSLSSPHFLYVSGSMFQIYPFLRKFIDTTYSSAKGPIFLRNLTYTDIPGIVNFIQSDGVFDFKLSVIDQIKGMYPNKKFLAIGDSTQKDPETYGAAFRRYGDFIACAWIRKFDGANNTAERFNAAFAGVPSNKYRIYEDSEIARLATINVAGGEC
ncbi:hypothetical protein AX17_007038 [Amanita inopinata Kibby_2008]|nr:hypothetical protein AX17_007038 [Amanita inopinata Kibby_2008]